MCGYLGRTRGGIDEGTKEAGTHEEEGIHPHASDAGDTADDALWIYRVAFEELNELCYSFNELNELCYPSP